MYFILESKKLNKFFLAKLDLLSKRSEVFVNKVCAKSVLNFAEVYIADFKGEGLSLGISSHMWMQISAKVCRFGCIILHMFA